MGAALFRFYLFISFSRSLTLCLSLTHVIPFLERTKLIVQNVKATRRRWTRNAIWIESVLCGRMLGRFCTDDRLVTHLRKTLCRNCTRNRYLWWSDSVVAAMFTWACKSKSIERKSPNWIWPRKIRTVLAFTFIVFLFGIRSSHSI